MAEDRPKKTTPMTIFFSGDPKTKFGMKFYGRSIDPKGKAVAKAEFYRDVHAETEDASLDCEEIMRAYFDRPVKLAQAKASPAKPPAGAESDKAEEPRARSPSWP